MRSPFGPDWRALVQARTVSRRRLVVAAAIVLPAVLLVALAGSRLLSRPPHPTARHAQPSAQTVSASPSAAPAPGASARPGPAATATPAPRAATFPVPGPAGQLASAATLGPDGAVWFTAGGPPLRIGRVSSRGIVQTFALPGDPAAAPGRIAAGPDGALWFTRGDAIGRLTLSGQYSEHRLPTTGAQAAGIVAGPDGTLWFTEETGNRIGAMTTSGRTREFALPSAPPVQCGQYCPGDITLGPDGALWFVNTQLTGVPGIGRVTSGGAISLYPLPAGSVPGAITSGPDGNLWFTEDRGPGLGRITPAGRVTEYRVAQPGTARGGITRGPDGAVWFTVAPGQGDLSPTAPLRPGQLGRVAPDGAITYLTPPGGGATGPIVLGADGRLWAFGAGTVTSVALS